MDKQFRLYKNKVQKSIFQTIKCRSDAKRELNSDGRDLTKKFPPD